VIVLAALAAAALAPTSPVSAEQLATRISSWGPRPAASAAERRAHRHVAGIFRRTGRRVGVQRFDVPGRGRSRNVIGGFDTDRSCLRIAMAHTDTTPSSPGANDNASGVGVLAALAGRLRGSSRPATSGSSPPAPRSASIPARPTTGLGALARTRTMPGPAAY
jgi:Peptidase family M28